MLTNGTRVPKAKVGLRAIRRTMHGVELPFEVIVAGVVSPYRGLPGLVLLPAAELALGGWISAVRNAAGDRAQYDTVVFLDDDVVLSRDWARRLLVWSADNEWDVVGHRILLPDGGRYWDKATIEPHQLVDYHVESRTMRYQCGCLWIIRRRVFEMQRWDPEIRFYADRSGGQNEDVEYSLRLQEQGFGLAFDPVNLAWHNDDRYIQVGDTCTLKTLVPPHAESG